MKPSIFSLCLLGVVLWAQTPGEFDILANHTDYREIRNMLPVYLKRLASERLAERARRIEGLSARNLDEHRRRVREAILRGIGGLPERTPLNARVTGVLEREDYRIEKIIFESQPGFHVTANLYLPKGGSPPYPAVLYPLGHEPGAKAYPVWQRMLATLARNGYVALAWDTVGQGERIQLYDEDFGGSKLVQSTLEHTMQGIQCLLVGDSLARYTIWDGIRALDYLLSRPEVDAKRVAVTGNSGGGTHTAYLAALEDRLHVAAPSCYLTSWSRLLDTIGPQDAEQCFPGWLAAGLDHADFVLAFAPKPYLILAAIRDFFSIAGARATYAEARAVFERLGAGERIGMGEADDGHGYSEPRRRAAYRWFERWLKGAEREIQESEVLIAREDELWCTRRGQVVAELGGETVFTLNRKRAEALKRPGPPVSRQTLVGLLAVSKPAGSPLVKPLGVMERSGYRIEKLVYESEPGIEIPAVLAVPATPAGRKPGVIVVHGAGKSAARAELEMFVQSGMVVLALDARGWGETRPATATKGADWPRYFGDYDSAMTSLLLDRPLVGQRVTDILRGLDLLAAHAEVDPGRICGAGLQAGGIPLLHAAVLDDRIRKLALERTLGAYECVVRHRIHRGIFESVVFGVLKAYDLPDLAATLAPRKLWLIDVANQLGEPMRPEEARGLYAVALKAGNTQIVRRRPEQPLASVHREFIETW
ncbi:MAG: acetylxylan esterase [Bryobacterales bacterium]|nr:acetylxylan esterase [Bryobacteraceae bacterium]MDW8131575.1 acetylxylan esterase [Bryobacterales bacterium]